MRINHVDDITKFFDIVNDTKGSVYLVSDRGDAINLKSELSQLYAAADIFSGRTLPAGMKLQVSDPSDIRMLSRFLNDGDRRQAIA